MYDMKVLGNHLLVQVLHIQESEIIEMSDAEKRVNRFSKIIGAGPDVTLFKLGDEVLIPDKEERVLFATDGREFAVFPETAVKIVKEIEF